MTLLEANLWTGLAISVLVFLGCLVWAMDEK